MFLSAHFHIKHETFTWLGAKPINYSQKPYIPTVHYYLIMFYDGVK